jgi:hypothetical protein
VIAVPMIFALFIAQFLDPLSHLIDRSKYACGNIVSEPERVETELALRESQLRVVTVEASTS